MYVGKRGSIPLYERVLQKANNLENARIGVVGSIPPHIESIISNKQRFLLQFVTIFLKKTLDWYCFFFVYYSIRFEIVRGWVTGHTEMANDL